MREVLLEHLTPRDFERLVAEIYDSLGYDTVVPAEGAEQAGRVMARSSDVWLVIACKHYLGGAVGRSAVQQLHSAILACEVPLGVNKRGAVVTSGRFTPDARSYVERCGLPIALIDEGKLATVAASAGIHIAGREPNADPTPPALPVESERDGHAISIPGEDELQSIFDRWILGRVYCSPREAILETADVRVLGSYATCYRVTLEYEKDFYAQGGRHLGRTAGTQFLWMDADSLASRPASLMESVYGAAQFDDVPPPIEPPLKTLSEGIQRARSELISMTQREVSYVGGNNQQYSKVLTLVDKDQRLVDAKLVFVPGFEVSVRFGGGAMETVCMLAGQKVLIIETGFPKKSMLCTTCHRLYRLRTPFDPQKVDCHVCSMSVCSQCSTDVRFALIHKRRYCTKHFTPAVKQASQLENACAAVAALAVVVLFLWLSS